MLNNPIVIHTLINLINPYVLAGIMEWPCILSVSVPLPAQFNCLFNIFILLAWKSTIDSSISKVGHVLYINSALNWFKKTSNCTVFLNHTNRS